MGDRRKKAEDVMGVMTGALGILSGVGKEMKGVVREKLGVGEEAEAAKETGVGKGSGVEEEGRGSVELLREELAVMRLSLAKERQEREALEVRVSELEGGKGKKKKI
jgi:hypothetical protein